MSVTGRTVKAGRPQSAAGQRDRYVLIETVLVPKAQFPEWVSLGYEWMSRGDLTADEHFASDQKSAYGNTQWHMAYRADMDPELVDVPAERRLVYEDRVYEIVTASPLGWKRDIELITLARMG